MNPHFQGWNWQYITYEIIKKTKTFELYEVSKEIDDVAVLRGLSIEKYRTIFKI